MVPLVWIAALFSTVLMTSCGTSTASDGGKSHAADHEIMSAELDPYWYQGKAEVSSYELSQARYRDEHPGDAVLVFVAEDFLTDKQVKNETYSSDASTKVLKANMMRKFTTGIYDYSIMTSVFSPANTPSWPHALKVTMSAQDWCGQNFVQLNRVSSNYRLTQFSYFEREGDVVESIDGDAWLEDELWTRLRMDPYALPRGEVEILPSLATLRLLHMENAPLTATAKLADYEGDAFQGADLLVYSIEYIGTSRVLSIVFEAAAPHKIAGWTEVSRGGLMTVAKKKAEVLTPYWSQNSLRDSTMRNFLKL